MFFKKKEAPKETKDLLYKENIIVDCKETDKTAIIKALGELLVKSGYVNPPYIQGMLDREQTFSTYMGSGLAIPHGVEAAKQEVLHSGFAVMTFPNGIVWDEEPAHLVVGIASQGEAHLEILATISEFIMEEEEAKKLFHGDVDTIYKMLTGKQ
ncbi:MAG: PTS sugar transporter subunit IIA [Eubacteriales bacterium]